MGKSLNPPRKPAHITSDRIKHLAGIGMQTPSVLTNKQIQELAASVERHIESKKKK